MAVQNNVFLGLTAHAKSIENNTKNPEIKEELYFENNPSVENPIDDSAYKRGLEEANNKNQEVYEESYEEYAPDEDFQQEEAPTQVAFEGAEAITDYYGDGEEIISDNNEDMTYYDEEEPVQDGFQEENIEDDSEEYREFLE